MKSVASHTREPWSLNPIETHPWRVECETQIPGIKGTICDVSYKPNARRIVACVNACKDISTDILESTSGLDELYSSIQGERDKLLKIADYVANNLGEFAGAMETQEKADVLTGYADALFKVIAEVEAS